MLAKLIQVSTSDGGMPKLPLAEAKVTFDGLITDWQNNRKHHGGRDRAVCLYSLELHEWLATRDVAISPGQLGENFTTSGIDLLSLNIGDRLQVGNCLIELTSLRVPCTNLNRWHRDLLKIIKGGGGWRAGVMEEGIVRPGDAIELKTTSGFTTQE